MTPVGIVAFRKASLLWTFLGERITEVIITEDRLCIAEDIMEHGASRIEKWSTLRKIPT